MFQVRLSLNTSYSDTLKWSHSDDNDFRKNLTCVYPSTDRRQSLEASSDSLWYENIVSSDHDQAHAKSLNLPTIMFLDPGILQHGYIETPSDQISVPSRILDLLGDMNELHFIAAKYFKHINPWMPFISRKRFDELHLRSSFPSKSESVFLLLSMKLITTLPPSDPRNARTSLYQAVKHFCVEIEGSNLISLTFLQGLLLLALYELGHAIYPAAYLTIGACARYAYALDIKIGRVPSPRRMLTLIEVEERRRVWWAIVILDRSVTLVLTINNDVRLCIRLTDLVDS